MDEQQLKRVANDAAVSLPGVTFEHRENPDWEMYKVAGKLFMHMTDLPGHTVVTVKIDPDEGLALREQYEEVSEGYHSNKRHWVSAAAGPAIHDALVRRLVSDSYDLVVAKLPPSLRSTVPAHNAGAAS